MDDVQYLKGIAMLGSVAVSHQERLSTNLNMDAWGMNCSEKAKPAFAIMAFHCQFFHSWTLWTKRETGTNGDHKKEIPDRAGHHSVRIG